jgi:hypothetical protein
MQKAKISGNSILYTILNKLIINSNDLINNYYYTVNYAW